MRSLLLTKVKTKYAIYPIIIIICCCGQYKASILLCYELVTCNVNIKIGLVHGQCLKSQPENHFGKEKYEWLSLCWANL